jgi:hypothetical protein
MEVRPLSQTQIADRWTIYVCTGCGGATGRHDKCDAKREAIEVMPVSEHEALLDQAIEKLA